MTSNTSADAMIREDAEKEYSLGDVDRATLDKFLAQLG